MHVSVNGVRLFFDVEGPKLVPDGPTMREKPVLLMLHGGPGFDHSIYRPAYSALADIAQVVYLDHRGNGRSEDGPREGWNLAQWGDDVRAFCDVLGIADPIVLGASFGGMVALAYATRHPAHPSRLILISTEAAGGSYREQRVALFERFGGPEVGARRAPSAGRRCCNGSPGPAARAAASISSRICIASSARRWCLAAKTIRFIRSRARLISQPPCRRIWCGSNGSPTADTPASRIRPSRRWPRSEASSRSQNKTGARRRRF
jgi:pimeloyl-ACP methyl ester carboxylesterase